MTPTHPDLSALALDGTHDPALRSWVTSANDGHTDFPIQNLPHGVFRRRAAVLAVDEPWRGGVAIGDQILDLRAALLRGVFDAEPLAAVAAQAAAEAPLNRLMALGPAAWRALRHALSALLAHGAGAAQALAACLVPQAAAEMALPAQIGDYTDFFTSRTHMRNAGRVFQPGAPDLPQFAWLPIAYHGRASTVEVSGSDFQRPWGQRARADGSGADFGPSQQIDFELELGCYIGPGTPRGVPVAADEAPAQLFGLCLLNDWSARDVQAWESRPLGPFLAKNFLTSVSPWVVTMAALAPFRCALGRSAADPLPPPNLRLADPWPGLDLQLEVWLQTTAADTPPTRLVRTSFRHGHWALAQMVAHHTEGGCRLRPGDLIGSGTQSGEGPGEQGCLLELTHGGGAPISLPSGERRSFLEDGDTVVLRGWAERPGTVRIGFGECRGTVLPAAPARH